MKIVLIFIIVALTIMYITDKIADIFKAKYENKDKKASDTMINHQKQYKYLEDTFAEVTDSYIKFKSRLTEKDREELNLRIKQHRKALNNFRSSINDVFIGGTND